jgi:catechol 2,3-dioxygenase-like lactoylglutathione lyase family enzyme
MQPRIHVITLAVAELDRALAFYRDGLGFAPPGVIGNEPPGRRARRCSPSRVTGRGASTRATSRTSDGHLWKVLHNPALG